MSLPERTIRRVESPIPSGGPPAHDLNRFNTLPNRYKSDVLEALSISDWTTLLTTWNQTDKGIQSLAPYILTIPDIPQLNMATSQFLSNALDCKKLNPVHLARTSGFAINRFGPSLQTGKDQQTSALVMIQAENPLSAQSIALKAHARIRELEDEILKKNNYSIPDETGVAAKKVGIAIELLHIDAKHYFSQPAVNVANQWSNHMKGAGTDPASAEKCWKIANRLQNLDPLLQSTYIHEWKQFSGIRYADRTTFPHETFQAPNNMYYQFHPLVESTLRLIQQEKLTDPVRTQVVQFLRECYREYPQITNDTIVATLKREDIPQNHKRKLARKILSIHHEAVQAPEPTNVDELIEEIQKPFPRDGSFSAIAPAANANIKQYVVMDSPSDTSKIYAAGQVFENGKMIPTIAESVHTRRSADALGHFLTGEGNHDVPSYEVTAQEITRLLETSLSEKELPAVIHYFMSLEDFLVKQHAYPENATVILQAIWNQIPSLLSTEEGVRTFVGLCHLTPEQIYRGEHRINPLGHIEHEIHTSSELVPRLLQSMYQFTEHALTSFGVEVIFEGGQGILRDMQRENYIDELLHPPAEALEDGGLLPPSEIQVLLYLLSAEQILSNGTHNQYWEKKVNTHSFVKTYQDTLKHTTLHIQALSERLGLTDNPANLFALLMKDWDTLPDLDKDRMLAGGEYNHPWIQNLWEGALALYKTNKEIARFEEFITWAISDAERSRLVTHFLTFPSLDQESKIHLVSHIAQVVGLVFDPINFINRNEFTEAVVTNPSRTIQLLDGNTLAVIEPGYSEEVDQESYGQVVLEAKIIGNNEDFDRLPTSERLARVIRRSLEQDEAKEWLQTIDRDTTLLEALINVTTPDAVTKTILRKLPPLLPKKEPPRFQLFTQKHALARRDHFPSVQFFSTSTHPISGRLIVEPSLMTSIQPNDLDFYLTEDGINGPIRKLIPEKELLQLEKAIVAQVLPETLDPSAMLNRTNNKRSEMKDLGKQPSGTKRRPIFTVPLDYDDQIEVTQQLLEEDRQIEELRVYSDGALVILNNSLNPYWNDWQEAISPEYLKKLMEATSRNQLILMRPINPKQINGDQKIPNSEKEVLPNGKTKSYSVREKDWLAHPETIPSFMRSRSAHLVFLPEGHKPHISTFLAARDEGLNLYAVFLLHPDPDPNNQSGFSYTKTYTSFHPTTFYDIYKARETRRSKVANQDASPDSDLTGGN